MKHTNAIRQSFAFTIIFCFLFSINAISQTVWDTLPWKQHADYQLQNLNKTLIPTGILYDRVFPFANADEYTGLPAFTNIDTTSAGHFTQAYYEMYNSTYNNTSLLAPDSLDNKIKSDGLNTVPIGILLYKFNSVDTNALQDHLLDTLVNGQFTDVQGRPRSPYFTNTTLIASPLLAEGEVLEAGQQTFYIDPAFFLTNNAGTVQQIRIDFW